MEVNKVNTTQNLIDISMLNRLPFKDFVEQVKLLGIDTGCKDRFQLNESLYSYATEKNYLIRDEGILIIVKDLKHKTGRWGYLLHNNLQRTEYDIYVSDSQIVKFNLKEGDTVEGISRPAQGTERYPCLMVLEKVNYLPYKDRSRTPFNELTAIYPNSKIKLTMEESDARELGVDNTSLKLIDIFSPIGKGTRGLIVAPPKTGKTTLLKDIARSIVTQNPDFYLMILLIDERPEEVTDIVRGVVNTEHPENVRVLHSTFDRTPENHIRLALAAQNISKRMAESGRDVVILLDSLTRLARASNITTEHSGMVLSGGINPKSLYMPKSFLGTARNIEEGGSVTIIATALVDTGSKMDDAIFEEFKATGNMELILDRDMAERRVFPAIDVKKSGTRHDELIYNKADYRVITELSQTVFSKMSSEDIVLDIKNADSVGAYLLKKRGEK